MQTTPTTIRQVLKWLEESDQWDDSWIDLDDPCCPINRRRMKYSFRIGNGPFVAPSPDQPMTSISWYGCEAFTQWLSKQHRAKFRLVKEVEWEYAARAGSTGKWCCGNDETQLGEYAWYKKNAGRLTRIVGQKKPNAFGLYDLHGNCWEWCLDWYDATFYANSSIDDPFNAIPASYRVIRGGGSDYSSQLCRSANRHWYSKDSQFHSLGFRVAAVQSGQ